MKKIISGALLFVAMIMVFSQGKAFASTYQQQNVTAYTAASGKLTYYETTPVLYSTAAVRPNVCGSPSSQTFLPKGTIITTTTKFSFPDGRLRNSFSVYDMADQNCVRNLTPYFFDIYFGVTNTSNVTLANDFGAPKTDYTTN